MTQNILERFSGAEILKQTPATLQAMLSGTSAEQRDWQPNPERWSVSMVMAHLADIEANAFGKRFRAMADSEMPALPKYDQQGLFQRGTRFDGMQELGLFQERRRETLAWLKTQPASVADRGGVHGELGPITFGQLLHEFAFHDLGHIRQIAELLRTRVFYPEIGAFQKYFTVSP